MTLDEHIKKAEEDAERAEFDTEWGIGNYFIDRTEALEYAKECRQLAEWLKDYKRFLEQEPFINKPCVSKNVCEHDKQMILDKIRAEIDSHCSDNRDRNDGLYIAMKIIDKYIAEKNMLDA